MATLQKLYGTQIVIYVPAVQAATGRGATKPLDPSGKIMIVRRQTTLDRQTAQLVEIPGASAVLATPQQVADLNYAGDKSAATWFIVTLPGGGADGSFGLLSSANIMLFIGSSDASDDWVAATAPFTVQRIAAGDERVI